jgi:hypothetical protein
MEVGKPILKKKFFLAIRTLAERTRLFCLYIRMISPEVLPPGPDKLELKKEPVWPGNSKIQMKCVLSAGVRDRFQVLVL